MDSLFLKIPDLDEREVEELVKRDDTGLSKEEAIRVEASLQPPGRGIKANENEARVRLKVVAIRLNLPRRQGGAQSS